MINLNTQKTYYNMNTKLKEPQGRKMWLLETTTRLDWRCHPHHIPALFFHCSLPLPGFGRWKRWQNYGKNSGTTTATKKHTSKNNRHKKNPINTGWLHTPVQGRNNWSKTNLDFFETKFEKLNRILLLETKRNEYYLKPKKIGENKEMMKLLFIESRRLTAGHNFRTTEIFNK